MKYDVIAIGELLIDFMEIGLSKQDNPILEANPGGAPCNVLAMLSKFGKKTAFIGKVGNDGFGSLLKNKIEKAGIDSTYLKIDNNIPTTLAIVTHDAKGDRNFSFYRKPGADINLNVSELDKELFANSKVFHFGTLSFTDEPIRSVTKEALSLAKINNQIISFDPNLRERLWNTLDEARLCTDYGLQYADIVKISDNEIEWFTGIKDYNDASNLLLEKYPNIKLLAVSLGDNGSLAYTREDNVYKPAFVNTGNIETTGCGDTFMGCIINYVLDNGLDLNKYKLEEMLSIANAAASIVSTRSGALSVMPTIEEINKKINNTI